MEADREARVERLVRRVILAGWACVLLSAVFLYLSKSVGPGEARDSPILFAIYLMLARLFGIASFAIGGVSIYNHHWTAGVMMMLSSVVLPIFAFLVHGTI